MFIVGVIFLIQMTSLTQRTHQSLMLCNRESCFNVGLLLQNLLSDPVLFQLSCVMLTELLKHECYVEVVCNILSFL